MPVPTGAGAVAGGVRFAGSTGGGGRAGGWGLAGGMVLGAGVGGAGACPPAGEDWYAGVGIEGALGSLAMLCCKSFKSSSLSVFRANTISLHLFWNLTKISVSSL